MNGLELGFIFIPIFIMSLNRNYNILLNYTAKQPHTKKYMYLILIGLHLYLSCKLIYNFQELVSIFV